MLNKLVYLSVSALILSIFILPDLPAQNTMPGSDPNRRGDLYEEMLDKAGVRSRNSGSDSYRNRPRYDDNQNYQRRYDDSSSQSNGSSKKYRDTNYDYQESNGSSGTSTYRVR